MGHHIRQYEMRLSETKWQQTTGARLEAGKLWSRLVLLHHYCRKHQLKWPSSAKLQAHFKGRHNLHSQSAQAIIQKFVGNVDATRTKRQRGDPAANYPWRQKRFANVVWKGQSVRREGHYLVLPMGRGRQDLRVRLPEMPEATIAQVELAFGKMIVTFKSEWGVATRQAGVAAVDLGLIHLAVVTDGHDSLAVVGRGLRTIKQRRHKGIAAIKRLQSKCNKGSRRWRKLQAARRRLSLRTENQSRNLLHHAATAVVGYCAEHQVGTLVVGDVTDINRGKKGKRSKSLNQQLGTVELGRLVSYLGDKGEKVGLQIKVQNEAYTSQTCPALGCGRRNKVKGRVYTCKSCGFSAARDEVGAYNQLNKRKNGEIVPGAEVPPGKIKYLRPVALRAPGRSRAADTCRQGIPGVACAIQDEKQEAGLFGAVIDGKTRIPLL